MSMSRRAAAPAALISLLAVSGLSVGPPAASAALRPLAGHAQQLQSCTGASGASAWSKRAVSARLAIPPAYASWEVEADARFVRGGRVARKKVDVAPGAAGAAHIRMRVPRGFRLARLSVSATDPANDAVDVLLLTSDREGCGEGG